MLHENKYSFAAHLQSYLYHILYFSANHDMVSICHVYPLYMHSICILYASYILCICFLYGGAMVRIWQYDMMIWVSLLCLATGLSWRVDIFRWFSVVGRQPFHWWWSEKNGGTSALLRCYYGGRKKMCNRWVKLIGKLMTKTKSLKYWKLMLYHNINMIEVASLRDAD